MGEADIGGGRRSIKSLGLLTLKPIIYATNVEDGDLSAGNEMVENVRKIATEEGAKVVVVSAQVLPPLLDAFPRPRSRSRSQCTHAHAHSELRGHKDV